MKKAEYFTELTKRSIPYFGKMMDCIEQWIARSAEKGYTKLTVSVEGVLCEIGITEDEEKYSSLRNLVIKEIKDKGFSYSIVDNNFVIYW